MVAIDYTASNGSPDGNASLHYKGTFNSYQKAILSVGSIIENYDSDKSFPVYGFGGIPRHMKKKEISHCFPLNGNKNNAELKRTEGILKAYSDTLEIIE